MTDFWPNLWHPKRRVRNRRVCYYERKRRAADRRYAGHHLWLERKAARRAVQTALEAEWLDISSRQPVDIPLDFQVRWILAFDEST